MRCQRVGPLTVLLLDEAAMLATDDLAALTKAVLAGRGKLVLVGDPAQIGPVERATGLLPALANRVGAIELGGIRRFTQSWEADATRQLRKREPGGLGPLRRPRPRPPREGLGQVPT